MRVSESMRPSRIKLAESAIFEFFENAPKEVYTPTELTFILRLNRSRWCLPEATTSRDFIEFLLRETKLQEVEFASKMYGRIVRFPWGTCSQYVLGLSLRSNSYRRP